MTLKAVIIDDEKKNVELLEYFISKYCNSFEVVGRCTNFHDSITTINKLRPDIIFLDIDLGNDRTGFDLIDKIDFYNTKIIFVTAFNDFAIKAIKYQAFDYILKPIKINDLINLVKRVNDSERIEHNNFPERKKKYISIASLDKINLISEDDIFYLKSSGKYTEFHTKTGRIVSSTNLGHYDTNVLSKKFIRIHYSFIVNSIHINHISKQESWNCILKNGNILPISRRKRKDITSFF